MVSQLFQLIADLIDKITRICGFEFAISPTSKGMEQPRLIPVVEINAHRRLDAHITLGSGIVGVRLDRQDSAIIDDYL
jgi:hypothetical protein